MEERSAKPAKQVEVNSLPIDRFKIPVRKGQTKAPKASEAKEASSRQTLADYVPPAMDDPGIDKAIDDIIVSESNEVLVAEDSMLNSSSDARPSKKKPGRLIKLLKSKWLYIGLAAVIIGIFAWPTSRYLILGQFLTNEYKFSVIDSVTLTPVSGASLKVGKESVTTSANGQTELKLALGKHRFVLSKHFYASVSGYIFVGIKKAQTDNIRLHATGRQVPITVINKLSGRLLAGVKISILNTSALTNNAGQSEIVLPTKDASYEATITANDFNTLTTAVMVTTSSKVNVINLVPAGYVYYLSNATGTINVIKADLDGSNPTIELAGTGKESASTTELLPSPDGKYLLLAAERNGSQPELYIINTSTGNLTEFDSATDSFTLIGWSGDLFIYDEVAGSESTSTTGREQLKSYNALNGQLDVLDQDQVAGSTPSYGYQSFAGFQLLSDQIVYTTSWNSVGSYDISSENDTIRSVEPNGLSKKDYTTFQASEISAMSIVRNLPQNLYVAVNNSSSNQTSYYSFSSGALSSASITASTFSATNPIYYISPSGEESLWNVTTNNQPQIFTGNQTGQNPKRLIVPAGYSAYSWYDNIYILLTKNSELYIAPASGSNSPVLIGSYI